MLIDGQLVFGIFLGRRDGPRLGFFDSKQYRLDSIILGVDSKYLMFNV